MEDSSSASSLPILPFPANNVSRVFNAVASFSEEEDAGSRDDNDDDEEEEEE